jgi:hypothetical protein
MKSVAEIYKELEEIDELILEEINKISDAGTSTFELEIEMKNIQKRKEILYEIVKVRNSY